MAIWSLTQERVEKLLKQIGDKEEEIDTLIKLSPKDIWTVDLEAFIAEWNLQIDEDAKRKKKIAGITRRASQKLGIGASKGAKGKKKRKMDGSDSDDDSGSDFGPAKKKTKPKKEGLLSYLRQDQEPAKKLTAAEALKSSSAFGSTVPQKQGTLLSHLVKKESSPQTDGPLSVPAKKARPAAKKPIPVIDSDEDISDVFAAVAKEEAKKPAAPTSRAARGATKQASKYTVDNSDSDSGDDDLLGDVSLMVKGIGAGGNEAPMFKSSVRPGSSAGATKAAKKSSALESFALDDDETNYEALAPPPEPSPRRLPSRSIMETVMSLDEDDDLSLIPKKSVASKLAPPKPKASARPVVRDDTNMDSDDEDLSLVTKKPVAKSAPKAKITAAKPVPKAKTLTSTAAKNKTLSPAAKAYAKKKETLAKPAPKSKKPVTVDSDEDMEDVDQLASDILSDDDDDETEMPVARSRAPAARPGRRAAAAPAKYVLSDDDEDSAEASEASFDDESE